MRGNGAFAGSIPAALCLLVAGCPFWMQTVTAPPVTGLTQAEAEAAIADAGLSVGTVTTEYSDTVPAGRVIRQDPQAGSDLEAGTPVDLVVSLGPAWVTVPNVVGRTQTEAQATITSVGLAVGAITQEHSPSIPVGSVIRQDPAAGTEVASGTAVDLVISLGPRLVATPNVVGMTQEAAEAAIVADGLSVGMVSDGFSASVPPGDVIEQVPEAGREVAEGTPVHLMISLGPAIAVPDVVAMTQAAAAGAITGAGLAVGAVTTEHSDTVPAGRVIRQDPAAGAAVAAGTPVDLVVSLGVVTTPVPDVVGLLHAQAQAAIVEAGLTVGAVTTEHSDTVPAGRVIRQDPEAGTPVVLGAAVDLVVSLGGPGRSLAGGRTSGYPLLRLRAPFREGGPRARVVSVAVTASRQVEKPRN